MDGFEQSSMNMIAHNRVLLEVGGYILLVDARMLYTEIDKINRILSLFSITFSKIWKWLRARKQSSLPFP